MKKTQEGSLIIAAVFIIMIVGAIGSILVNMSAGNMNATLRSVQSAQAFYVAESGRNQAMRYFYAKGVTCANITGNADLTNSTVGSGQFTATGTSLSASTTLNGNITSSATTIAVTSTTGFAASGEIVIGNEAMYYTGISGNNFTGVLRGAALTTAAAQSNGATVTQNSCVITVTSGVPNLTSPVAETTLSATMFSTSSVSLLANFVAIGNVKQSSGGIYNDHACLTCSNYSGSTIQTNGTFTISNGSTKVDGTSADNGTLVNSSTPGNIKADVNQSTSFTTSSLWNNYFTQSRATVQSYAAAHGYNGVGSGANNKSGMVIWATSDVAVNGGGGQDIGTLANPVVLIVNGNLSISGGNVYGLVYVTGDIACTSGTVNGSAGAEGKINYSNTTFTYNYSLLTQLASTYNFINATSVQGYVVSTAFANAQENFL